jgi:toxin ParE1/3/4
MQIFWLRRALKNLQQAHDFVAGDNADAAIHLIIDIHTAVQNLESFPMMGRSGRVTGTRELPITGTPYLVIYRIRGQRIDILRVLHGARKYP